MENHETILKMIEEVDPKDTAKLDEIDGHVMAYAGYLYEQAREFGISFSFLKRDLLSPAPFGDGFTGRGIFLIKELEETYDLVKYTRSRDALKAIRPKDWSFSIVAGHYFCECELNNKGWEKRTSAHLPTEELAELHAIIQAIEYERAQNDKNTQQNTI